MKQLKIVLFIPYGYDNTDTFRWEVSDDVANCIEKIMQEKHVSIVSDDMIKEAINAKMKLLKPLHYDLLTIGYDNLVCDIWSEAEYYGSPCMNAVYEEGYTINYDVCFLDKGEGIDLRVPTTEHSHRWSLKRFLKNLKPKIKLEIEWEDEM